MGVSSAEVFDPKTGTFDLTGSMSTERYACPAVSLADGRVLVLGGCTPTTFTGSTEVYTP